MTDAVNQLLHGTNREKVKGDIFGSGFQMYVLAPTGSAILFRDMRERAEAYRMLGQHD